MQQHTALYFCQKMYFLIFKSGFFNFAIINGEFYKVLRGQTMGEFLQCLLVKRTWTATLHPCRYRQTPEYTHGRQPTYMSCSVPRVFLVFNLAIFTRNEAHSLLFPNIVPKDDAKVQNFFVFLHYKLKLVKYAVPNTS